MQTALRWDKNVLEPVFRELFSREMKNKKDFIPLLYGVENSNKAEESIEIIGGEGLMEEWKYSNNQVFYDDIQELGQKYFRHKKFSIGRTIERDFVDDLKLTAIKDRIRSMADAVYKTLQLSAVETFNNADKTTGTDFRGRPYDATVFDGKPLCATDHPINPKDPNDGVQSNKGTDELSIDSWDATAVAMQEWKDDRGNPLVVVPDTLLVSPYNARRAFQIAGIPGKGEGYEPDTSGNFNINMYEGQIKVIVNPYLKNRKAWFAIDSTRMKLAHKWYWRRRPENGSIEDFDTEVMKYKTVGRWTHGAVDWTWLYGHFPA